MRCELAAGVGEAALCQTPNQNIQVKMVHDSSPRGPKAYRGLLHAVPRIYGEFGFAKGFFQNPISSTAWIYLLQEQSRSSLSPKALSQRG